VREIDTDTKVFTVTVEVRNGEEVAQAETTFVVSDTTVSQ
jgi:hypothetical protein